MKPCLRWVGGKQKLLPELLALFPQKLNTYFEPFLGGGAAFFATSHTPAVLGDLNPHLILFYDMLARFPDEVIARAKEIWGCDYYAARAWWNEHQGEDTERAAAFLYLNQKCFNGVWRENQDGDNNVPTGHRDVSLDEEGLRACAEALQGVRLVSGRWFDVLDFAERGDFAYLDPPYWGTFDGYSSEGFGPDDHARLAEGCRLLDQHCVKFALSNADVPEVRKLYEGFGITEISAPRSVAARGDKRARAREILVRNYG